MNYENITVAKKEKSSVEISGEIPFAVLEKYRAKALKELGDTVNMPGFRKGHIPEKVLVEKIGEMTVLEECAELALKDFTPEVIEKNAPNYIGRPKISITKLAAGNPLGFTILIAVIPEFKLPDYKKLASKAMSAPKEKVDVTDKEIEDVIIEIRKQRAHTDYHKAHADDKKHDHSNEEVEKHMPEITDETVKTLGDFKDVADFKAKIKENLGKEKEHKAIEKRRGGLLESLVADTKIEIPEPLIDTELSKMFAQFESDIAGLGLKVEDYLKHIKKTPEDLRKEWVGDAEKRAKLNLILEEIAKTEKISADPVAVEEEVKHLTTHYQNIDPIRAKVYVEHNLRMEKVIQFLGKREIKKIPYNLTKGADWRPQLRPFLLLKLGCPVNRYQLPYF